MTIEANDSILPHAWSLVLSLAEFIYKITSARCSTMSWALKHEMRLRTRAFDPFIPIGCVKGAPTGVQEYYPAMARNRSDASASTDLRARFLFPSSCSLNERDRLRKSLADGVP